MTVSHPFASPTATKVIQGIATCLSTGRAIDRDFIVRRFSEGGYADHLAERYADRLIAANTDISDNPNTVSNTGGCRQHRQLWRHRQHRRHRH